jgi:hypothetical protein
VVKEEDIQNLKSRQKCGQAMNDKQTTERENYGKGRHKKM